jgi:quercetin dioxygenase-like cupin family protein
VTFLTHRGDGPSFLYAGQPVHVLAGQGNQPSGFAAMELSVPAQFAGPIPHAHDEFDEAIYVLSGRLMVGGTGDLEEARPGSMFVAPRGQRHAFSNPIPEPALVLGLWGAVRTGAGVHARRRRRPAGRRAARPGPDARHL